jgi:hypothetical protein
MSLTVQPSESLESPLACQRRLDRLRGKRDEVQCQHHKLTQELQVANDFLAVADQVTAALEQRSVSQRTERHRINADQGVAGSA